MLSTILKHIFQKPSSQVIKKGMKCKIGIPSEPLPLNYLNDLSIYFDSLGFINRAAYCLIGIENNISLLIMLDFYPIGISNNSTLQMVIKNLPSLDLQQRQQVSPYPIDFSQWNESIAESIFTSQP